MLGKGAKEEMKTVWKYTMDMAKIQTIRMPQGAEILHVEVQMRCPCIWVLVDPTAPYEDREFQLAGTGHSINHSDKQLKHIGTCVLNGGMLVIHVFELKPLPQQEKNE